MISLAESEKIKTNYFELVFTDRRLRSYHPKVKLQLGFAELVNGEIIPVELDMPIDFSHLVRFKPSKNGYGCLYVTGIWAPQN